MGYELEWDAALESLQAMHKRGIRVLPGGDYGFALTPHGQNARDLEFFVKYLGFTPMEAIRSATLLRRPDHDEAATSSASVREGWLADLLLVDGDPLANLVDPARPEAAPRGHEGRRVRASRPRSRSRSGAWEPRRMSARSRGVDLALLAAVRRAGRRVRGLGASPTTRALFFKTLLNGLTLASLYFLVASGFTLVFGLMRNVNLAHGSLYLLGAYVGWVVGEHTGSWLLARRGRLRRRGASSAC